MPGTFSLRGYLPLRQAAVWCAGGGSLNRWGERHGIRRWPGGVGSWQRPLVALVYKYLL